MAKGLRRGFKAEAERLSEKIRSELGKRPEEALMGEELAAKMDITILTLNDIGLSETQLTKVQDAGYSFSAFTMVNHQEKKLIVHNEFHSPGRQQSNLMHEMAHIICEHPLPEPKMINGFPFLSREYNEVHEKEAEAMGGILQIPRNGLIWALKKGMSTHEIALHYGATKDMANFRIRITGVKKQMSRWR